MMSVIVPVYNVEPYLARCINSILQQSYTDFELLLVDDGSTDGSGKVCDKYAEKDNRIRVFHKENGGLSDARNYGLDRMAGEFVAFVDSDDYVGSDYLRILAETQAQFNADLVMLQMVSTNSKNLELIDSPDVRKSIELNEALKTIVLRGLSVCTKLFRRTLFETRRFPVGKLYEDLYTTPYVLKDCRICACSTSVQYYHYTRADSITHTISDSAIKMWNEGYDILYRYMENTDVNATDCVIYRYVCFGFPDIINNFIDFPNYTTTAKAYRDRHRDWWRRALRNPYLNKKAKFKAFLFLTNVDLYRAFHKCYFPAKAALNQKNA